MKAEEIPLTVVREFDMLDHGDPEVLPQSACEACRGAMYPVKPTKDFVDTNTRLKTGSVLEKLKEAPSR